MRVINLRQLWWLDSSVHLSWRGVVQFPDGQIAVTLGEWADALNQTHALEGIYSATETIILTQGGI